MGNLPWSARADGRVARYTEDLFDSFLPSAAVSNLSSPPCVRPSPTIGSVTHLWGLQHLFDGRPCFLPILSRAVQTRQTLHKRR
ncbi:hypothetical protein RRG08_029069 [Elysia crispata]|uniref:Uncharacterized protein n=1 Tax=Elysia crispata TaxID=231223 RepID=A0AAE0ZK72_9GAST|nr:hypothetical protein RRG08_029069 [Elysia crispata]